MSSPTNGNDPLQVRHSFLVPSAAQGACQGRARQSRAFRARSAYRNDLLMCETEGQIPCSLAQIPCSWPNNSLLPRSREFGAASA
jgi:hypothetical protein